jgi:hypothetical protein
MSDDTFSASDFESVASSDPASTPAESSASVETTAPLGAATTEPAVDATATATTSTEPTKPAGPIPFDVHKTALDNARVKAIEDYKQRYGWAEQVDANEFQQLQRIARHFSGGNVVEGIQNLIAEARKDPSVDAELRSFHARALASARGQSQPQAESEPQPDLPIELEGGRVVHLYSAEQQAKREAYLQKQWMQGVQQELQPLKQTHEHLQAQRAELAKQQEITHYVTSTYQDVQTWPGMESDANRKAVAEELGRATVNSDDPREVSLALNAAYRKVVLPTLQRTERQSVLDTIKQQANASTVNPSRTTARAPKTMDEMSIAEALAHVATQQA